MEQIRIFRVIEGIWLHRKGRQIRFFSEKTCFTWNVRNMFWATPLYKFHAEDRLRGEGQERIVVPIQNMQNLELASKHLDTYQE